MEGLLYELIYGKVASWWGTQIKKCKLEMRSRKRDRAKAFWV